MVNFTTVTCRISSRLKWYKNYKNRLRLAKVIVKNKMSHFLWFTVYIMYMYTMQCTHYQVVNSNAICTLLRVTCCWFQAHFSRGLSIGTEDFSLDDFDPCRKWPSPAQLLWWHTLYNRYTLQFIFNRCYILYTCREFCTYWSVTNFCVAAVQYNASHLCFHL